MGVVLNKCRLRRYTWFMKPLRTLLVLAACFVAFSASAQWQWIDKDGRRVFSDLPPPASVPDKNILKRPRGGLVPTEPAAPAAATPAAAGQAEGTPAQAPAGGVDKVLEERRKRAAAAEEAKRKAEEERNAQVRAENCLRAQQGRAGLDAGGRIARTNERGEREFMDENAIAAEQQRLQAIINENCR